jgi:hypothetical protein
MDEGEEEVDEGGVRVSDVSDSDSDSENEDDDDDEEDDEDDTEHHSDSSIEDNKLIKSLTRQSNQKLLNSQRHRRPMPQEHDDADEDENYPEDSNIFSPNTVAATMAAAAKAARAAADASSMISQVHKQVAVLPAPAHPSSSFDIGNSNDVIPFDVLITSSSEDDDDSDSDSDSDDRGESPVFDDNDDA